MISVPAFLCDAMCICNSRRSPLADGGAEISFIYLQSLRSPRIRKEPDATGRNPLAQLYCRMQSSARHLGGKCGRFGNEGGKGKELTLRTFPEKPGPPGGSLGAETTARRKRRTSSFVGEVQLVDVYGVRILPVIAIHLIVDRDSPPSWSGEGSIGPVQCMGLAIQRNRLVKQLIVGSSRHHV